MKIIESTIPEDKESIQALLLKYREENTTLQDKIKQLEEENRVIKEESSGLQSMLSRLQKMIFGPRSEKRTFTDPKQGLMFDEIEYNAEKTVQKERKIQVKGHERRKPVRRKLPEGIPRRLIEVHLHKDDLICEHGNEFKPIGKEITEKLDMIPPQFLVHQYARIKYALNGCEPSSHSAVRIAPMPPVLLPKSIAAEGLMAYFLISKYCDRLPLYHIEKMMSRYGIDYPRSTMCEELLQIYELYGKGLKKALTRELFKAPVMEIDETTLQVLNEPGRKNTTTSYMFVMKGGAKKKPVIYFNYRETRSPNFLLEFLDGYKGKVLTDGYPAYDKVIKKLNLSHAGCNQHSRRNFYYVAQSKESIWTEPLKLE